MPYVLPTFNVNFNCWTAYDPAVSVSTAPSLSGACNFSPGKRVFLSADNTAPSAAAFQLMEMLMPTGSGVAFGCNNPFVLTDLVEVPKNSKRYYVVTYVDFIALGFANQHMFALVRRYREDTVFADATIAYSFP